MDSITKRLISNKFQVPPEVMGLIDNHLLDIYREDHKQKIIIKDLKLILEVVKNDFIRNRRILMNMDMFIQIFKKARENNMYFDDNDENTIWFITKNIDEHIEIYLEHHKFMYK